MTIVAVLVELRRTDDDPTDDELMQVGVGPAESGLYHLMQLGEVEVVVCSGGASS